ncbi:MAG TPA: extracellular solute-binding protein, partial [Candidatus Lustribacter sp.]|nr:extracellular solute-binding protein [Candidatus Lustribacter sp.]
ADSLQPLDAAVVTDALLGNLRPEYRAMDVDPGNRFSVPWATGTTAIGYDSSVLTEPPTWDVFLDATYAGRMTLLNERREAFAAALISLGKDPNTRDAATIAEAEARLTRMAASSAFNSATYLDDLATGKVVVAQAFSTDVLQARKRNPKLAYTIPAAGATRWVDLLCIPADAPNAAAANAMIAYYLDPKVSATNAAYNLVATGNLKARDFVPKEVLDDPAVYPPDDVVAELAFLVDLGETEQVYDEAWKRVKS